MDDRHLTHLLDLRIAAPSPPLPPTFQPDVWREIRRRERANAALRPTWIDWLLDPLFKPAMAFASLALALAMGVGLGTAADSRNVQTRLALNLHVFGSSAPALPATLLGYTR